MKPTANCFTRILLENLQNYSNRKPSYLRDSLKNLLFTVTIALLKWCSPHNFTRLHHKFGEFNPFHLRGKFLISKLDTNSAQFAQFAQSPSKWSCGIIHDDSSFRFLIKHFLSNTNDSFCSVLSQHQLSGYHPRFYQISHWLDRQPNKRQQTERIEKELLSLSCLSKVFDFWKSLKITC